MKKHYKKAMKGVKYYYVAVGGNTCPQCAVGNCGTGYRCNSLFGM